MIPSRGRSFLSVAISRLAVVLEADLSCPFGAEVQNVWSCTSALPYVFRAWCLIARWDSFDHKLVQGVLGFGWDVCRNSKLYKPNKADVMKLSSFVMEV